MPKKPSRSAPAKKSAKTIRKAPAKIVAKTAEKAPAEDGWTQPGTLSPTAKRDADHHIHPLTNMRKLEAEGPGLTVARGEGVYVYDEVGYKYLEGMAGLACALLGFTTPQRLIDAATNQMKTLGFYHVHSQKTATTTAQLAEDLLKFVPLNLSKVMFANSGSEANDTAIKVIRYYNNARGKPQKKKIISRWKAYHGMTLGTSALTGLPPAHKDFDLPFPGVIHISTPHYWANAKDWETEEQYASRLAVELEDTIVREGPDTVAAFIAEPAMGAGGMIPPPKTYWEKIQPILKKYDVLLMLDEVLCGFWRTGKRFGAVTYDIKPDLMSVAKGLSSAYLPISALMMADHVYQVIADNSAKNMVFGHGFTYGGHPVSAALAIETLKLYKDIGIEDHVKKVSVHLQNGLRTLGRHELVGEARGVGMLGALELVPDKSAKKGFDKPGMIGGFFVQRAQQNGLIIRAVGDAIAVAPPLIITDAQIDEMMTKLLKTLDETHSFAHHMGMLKKAA
jgi:4-aminobutyrate--pyruvate transaminase